MNTNEIGQFIENFHKAFQEKSQLSNILSKAFKGFKPETYLAFKLEIGEATHSYMVTEDKLEESGIERSLTELIREHCRSILAVFKEQNLGSKFRIMCNVSFITTKDIMTVCKETEELKMDEEGNLIDPEFIDSVKKGIELSKTENVSIGYDFNVEIGETGDFKFHTPITNFYIEIGKRHVGYSKTSKKMLRYDQLSHCTSLF